MESKYNKIVITVTVIALLGVTAVPTVNHLLKVHDENLYKVTTSRIIDAAILCVKEEKCLNENITLEELYNYSYLKEEHDPVTKEVYSVSSYVANKSGNYEFIVMS